MYKDTKQKAKEFMQEIGIHPTYVVYTQKDFRERKEPLRLDKLLAQFGENISNEELPQEIIESIKPDRIIQSVQEQNAIIKTGKEYVLAKIKENNSDWESFECEHEMNVIKVIGCKNSKNEVTFFIDDTGQENKSIKL